jgi:CDP-4-dehydro-6-deoxyglucose reductase, E1
MSWKLNYSNFSKLDKLRACKLLLGNKQWTQGENVELFEQEMAQFVGCKYAVFVSSGSTANTLLAMYLKDKYGLGDIVFPSTT